MPPRLPDTVEHWPLDRLIPYARNARTHDEEQVVQIAASIVEFGWTNSVLVDSTGGVIAGHGRLLAAKKLGLDAVPVIVLEHLTPAQQRRPRRLARSLGPVRRRPRYVWHAGIHAQTVAQSLEACGFLIRARIIWAKARLVFGRGDYHGQYEPCFYAVRKGATGHWQGARDQSTLWTIAAGENDEATEHGAQKPVECMRRPIVNNSAKGDLVYEPFAGSGSTLIAAESVGRICLAMEIDPRYCDVVIGRWQRLGKGDAILANDGRAFDVVKQERSAA
jgi:DNA methylase/ParB/Sulfiredoxin domain